MSDLPAVTRDQCDARNGTLWTEIRVIRGEVNELKVQFGTTNATHNSKLDNIEQNQKLAAKDREKQSEEIKRLFESATDWRTNKAIIIAVAVSIMGLLAIGANISQVFSVVHK